MGAGNYESHYLLSVFKPSCIPKSRKLSAYPAGDYTQQQPRVSAVMSRAASVDALWCMGKCGSKCLCSVFTTKAAVKSHGATWWSEGCQKHLGFVMFDSKLFIYLWLRDQKTSMVATFSKAPTFKHRSSHEVMTHSLRSSMFSRAW